MASAAARCGLAAAACALLGAALLLSGSDLTSTSVLLRRALRGEAGEAPEGSAVGLASEEPRRLGNATVGKEEEDFFKRPLKERLPSEDAPLREMTSYGSCRDCWNSLSDTQRKQPTPKL